MLLKNNQLNIGELCNGSTTDSDSVCWGSNPYSPAKKKVLTLVVGTFFLVCNFIGIRTRRPENDKQCEVDFGEKQSCELFFSRPNKRSLCEKSLFPSQNENPVDFSR